MNIETRHIIVNAVLFQVLWFSAILTGWALALGPMLLLAAHFLFVVRDQKLRVACVALAICGAFADSALGLLGIYTFNEDALLVANTIPLWLVFMWLGFALCLPLSLNWLYRSPWLVLAFFSIGGPMSYVAGRSLGALAFDNADIWLLVLLWFAVALITIVASKVASNTDSLSSCEQVQPEVKPSA